jgi:hypothetical protein
MRTHVIYLFLIVLCVNLSAEAQTEGTLSISPTQVAALQGSDKLPALKRRISELESRLAVIERVISVDPAKGAVVKIEAHHLQLGGTGGEPLIKGTSFMTLYNSHVHTTTAPGASTSPALPPMTPAVLSTTSSTR